MLKFFKNLAFVEGVSAILLFFFAMPMKYIFDNPIYVKHIGMAHGILFITYIIILIGSAIKMKMPLWAIPAGVLGSLLPFGPFIFDHLLKNNLQKSVSKEA